MKIAFAATGNGWEEPTDTRFGRARGFFIVETDTHQTTYTDNEANWNADHGAGTGAAQSVAEAGVDWLVAPRVGPKAAAVLESAGVRVMQGPAGVPVREAYELLKNDLLQGQAAEQAPEQE